MDSAGRLTLMVLNIKDSLTMEGNMEMESLLGLSKELMSVSLLIISFMALVSIHGVIQSVIRDNDVKGKWTERGHLSGLMGGSM